LLHNYYYSYNVTAFSIARIDSPESGFEKERNINLF